MKFPNNFNGQLVWKSGRPLRRGNSIRFELSTIPGHDANDYRMVHAWVCRGNWQAKLDNRSVVCLGDLGISVFRAPDQMDLDPLTVQLKRIMAQVRGFRLTKQGDGFILEGYFSGGYLPDLSWTYAPEQGQFSADELLAETCRVEPTPICEVPEYRAVTTVELTQQAAA